MTPSAQRFRVTLLPGHGVLRPIGWRVATASPQSLLYALAAGAVVLIAASLPRLLTVTGGTDPVPAWTSTGALVVVVTGIRLAGGWRAGEGHPALAPLVACYAAAAILSLMHTVGSPGWPLLVPLLLGIAICDGLASGELAGLLRVTGEGRDAGAVPRTTVFGTLARPAVVLGPVAALAIPSLLAGSSAPTRSYATTVVLLAVGLLVVTLFLEVRGRQAGEVRVARRPRPSPEVGPTALTVVTLGEAQIRAGAAAVVARLAELAVNDELIVVCGSNQYPPAPVARILVARLRYHLPRHHLVAIDLTSRTGDRGYETAVLEELLEIGSVPIVVTETAAVRETGLTLSRRLQADRLVSVTATASGVDLYQMWPAPASGRRRYRLPIIGLRCRERSTSRARV